ncbi:hypothetical protein GP475_10315 [Corynebacterium poyangense]|uniref:Uncharacterized protein n=1 Tax=Corynebacterium poyangense TaxID=2684405 RepID=A0A7H0SR05_9CORY|nr:hypothetical protein [Corynebacterium poyangense]MBZ8176400.1 hypothetical protein [Corynebacterium poyangense]QNQ90980.1 hypothetical protein GP475_10315 [Corynebacterium poyangense]
MASEDPQEPPTLLIAEGVMMYLEAQTVARLLSALRAHFSAAEFCADSYDSTMLKNREHYHKFIKETTGAEYVFATNGAEGIAALSPGWSPVETIDVMSPIGRIFQAASKTHQLCYHGRLPYYLAYITSTT